MSSNWCFLVIGNSSVALIGRLESLQGQLFKQADLSTIVWDSVDLTAGGTPVLSNQPLTISDVIFDTPKTSTDDPRWKGSLGYNFAATIPNTAFPNDAKRYRLDLKVTDAASNQSRVPIRFTTVQTS